MSEKQNFFVSAQITSLPLLLNVHLFMYYRCRWNSHSCLSTFIILNTFVWSVSCPFLFSFSQNTIFLVFFNLSSFRNVSSCQIALIAHCWGLAIFWKSGNELNTPHEGEPSIYILFWILLWLSLASLLWNVV